MQLAVDSGKILRGSELAHRVSDLGKPALDAGQSSAIGACVATLLDALGQFAHLALDRLNRLARHRLLQHRADLSEAVAQRVDRLPNAAGCGRACEWRRV